MRLAVLGDTPLATAIRHHTHHVAHSDAEHATVIWLASAEVPDRIPGDCPVLLSSPWPVGTCAALEAKHPGRWFAVCPENVREAHAVSDFKNLSTLVVGIRHWKDATWIVPLLSPLGKELVYMTPESAEMVKHATNALLALQVEFGNEIGVLCEQVGADALDVVKVLRRDPRIGKAYIEPGGPPGPHLMRDVETLRRMGYRW